MQLFKDRVRETSTSSGTGNFTLAGAVEGFQSFNTAYGLATDLYYVIEHEDDWEIGIGQLSAPTTLVRNTVLASSNAGSPVNFSAGTKHVFSSVPAAHFAAPINLSAGGASQDLRSAVFSNSNGVSFGLAGSTITASHNALTNSALFRATSNDSQLRFTSADSQLQFTSAMSNFLGTAATQSFRFTSQNSQLQFTSQMSDYLGTGATQSFRHTSADSQLQFTSANSNFLGTAATQSFRHTSADSQLRFTSADSQLQFTSANSNFLGTAATQSFRHTSADSQLRFTSQNSQLQFTSQMSDYLGTGATQSFRHTSADTQLRFTSADSQLQFTSANSNFLGTAATQSFRHTSADSQLQFTSANTKFVQEWQLTGNSAGTGSSVQGSRLYFSGDNMLTISGSSNTIAFSVNTASLLGTGATASFRFTSQNSQLRFTSADSQLQFTSQMSDYLGTGATQSFRFTSQNSQLRFTSADTDLQFTSANTKFVQEWSLVGNTSGTNSSAQGSRMFFSGGANITLSGSSNSIVISAPTPATLSMWPDVLPASTAVSTYYSGSTSQGAGGASTQTGYTFSLYAVPLPLPAAVAFSEVRLGVSNNTAAGTGSVTHLWSAGFYSNNASTLGLVKAFYGGIFLSQNSQTSQTFSAFTVSTGGATAGGPGGFAGIAASSVYSRAVANMSSDSQMFGRLQFAKLNGAATTLTAGQYYFVFGHCTVSSGANVYSNVGYLQSNALHSQNIPDLGRENSTQTSNYLPAWGAISTTFTSVSNQASWFAMPANINIANMSLSSSAWHRFHLPVMRNHS
jgi:hypothetical protein